MTELTVHAKADHAYSPADGVSRVFLTVKVRSEGQPVKDLGTKNFTVWRGMQSWPIDLAVPLSETNMPGIFSLTMKDELSESFKGQIAFIIRVKAGAGRSQLRGWGLADLVKL